MGNCNACGSKLNNCLRFLECKSKDEEDKEEVLEKEAVDINQILIQNNEVHAAAKMAIN